MNHTGATGGIPTVASEGGASRPDREEGAVAHHCAMPTGSQTQVIEVTEVEGQEGPPTLKLRLKKCDAEGGGEKPKKIVKKQVSWTQETVDNEHLGKKKSKCCCVYVKPKKLGESDTESESGDDDDCKHCSGHTPSDPTQKGSRS